MSEISIAPSTVGLSAVDIPQQSKHACRMFALLMQGKAPKSQGLADTMLWEQLKDISVIVLDLIDSD
eukprot:7940679-Karenia_brevis.AAC.1